MADWGILIGPLIAIILFFIGKWWQEKLSKKTKDAVIELVSEVQNSPFF